MLNLTNFIQIYILINYENCENIKASVGNYLY